MPSLAILLCTYNGGRFLRAQLSSFADQNFRDWRLFISDDGSTDDTLAILAQYKDRLGDAPIVIRNGPRQGFVRNFLSLACDPTIPGQYFAYADQDDIWAPQKLARAVAWLEKRPQHMPAMYCSRTQLIDEKDHACGRSPLFRRPPSFRNALVQNIASGNTIVFNRATRALLMACDSSAPLPAHDWWTYLLTTAAGGDVYYDPVPQVRYRVHQRNVVGTNVGLFRRAHRLLMLTRGRFEHWTDLNVAALEPVREKMTKENRAVFDLFRESRTRGFIGRQIGFLESGVYRQTFLDNLGLIVAVWANKV